MRDLGVTPAPMSAYILNLGLESLHVRMKRHCENGLAVARYLEANDKIAWVNYPGLESSKDYEIAKKYMPEGTCGVVSFGVKGGREAASTFMNALQMIAIETHVADARSCCLHPATTTHRQLSDADLIASGVAPDLVRLSCGLEDADDLIADIQQALDKI
jgi:O-acetylhomoserine (thiol)-lyase